MHRTAIPLHPITSGIRKKNGGKAPNIVYIPVDVMCFGEFGIPELNNIHGYETWRLNKSADEELLMSIVRGPYGKTFNMLALTVMVANVRFAANADNKEKEQSKQICRNRKIF